MISLRPTTHPETFILQQFNSTDNQKLIVFHKQEPIALFVGNVVYTKYPAQFNEFRHTNCDGDAEQMACLDWALREYSYLFGSIQELILFNPELVNAVSFNF